MPRRLSAPDATDTPQQIPEALATLEEAQAVTDAPPTNQEWYRCLSTLEHPIGGGFFFVGQYIPPGTLTETSVAVLLDRAIIAHTEPPAAHDAAPIPQE